MSYLRYSGASISIFLNPLHWKIFPYFRKEPDVFSDSDHTYLCGFLFLVVRIWIDDGSW